MEMIQARISPSWDSQPEVDIPEEDEDVGMIFEQIDITEYDIEQEIDASLAELSEDEVPLDDQIRRQFT